MEVGCHSMGCGDQVAPIQEQLQSVDQLEADKNILRDPEAT